ncbi:MAG: hypothetical protein KDB27_31375 [Planctomycetales bacterium]|nr:hypothetical protein [Planctomycetales bacterium]
MAFEENAEMPYDPADDIQTAVAAAEQQLMSISGVNGVGITSTPDGQDAVVVYVANEKALSQLPAEINGCRIIGEVTGEIRPL